MKNVIRKKRLKLGFLLIAPLIVAATIKTQYTSPMLPTVTYHLPEDVSVEPQRALVNRVYDNVGLDSVGLNKKVLELALQGFSKLTKGGRLNADSILTIVDFSQSSKQKRLYVIDLKNEVLVFNTLVAHGMRSGMEYARSFSNIASSHKSSLGFYVTESTYSGENGYSLRLQGMERNINDKAFGRAIVMHGAKYATEGFLSKNGVLGRSFGCPAIPMEEHTEIIDVIKNGSCLFIYSQDAKYIKSSKILNG